MIHAATGLSTHAETLKAGMQAAREAVEGLGGRTPDFCVAFVSGQHAAQRDELLDVLAGTAGTPYIVGCSARGVIVDGREIEDGPSLGLLAVVSDRLRATPFLFEDQGDHGLTAGVQLGQRLQASKDTDDLVLVWPDPHHVRPDRLLQGIDATLGAVPVAGAAASGRPEDGSTFQFSGTASSANGVSGLRLGGQFRHHVVVTQGCRPLGGPLRVTRAHENLILEIDGRPALEVLAERSPRSVVEHPETMPHALFVGLLTHEAPPGTRAGDYLVRNIVGLDPDTGVIAIADVVTEGMHIVFAHREGRAAREDLGRVLQNVRAAAGDVSFRFGLYFNCLARGSSLYGSPGVDGRLLQNALPGVPLLGLFGNAEVAPVRGTNHVFTYTGVLVLVAD